MRRRKGLSCGAVMEGVGGSPGSASPAQEPASLWDFGAVWVIMGLCRTWRGAQSQRTHPWAGAAGWGVGEGAGAAPSARRGLAHVRRDNEDPEEAVC